MNKKEQNLNNAKNPKLGISDVIPRILYLIDNNGKKYKLNDNKFEYLVSIQKDGFLKFQIVVKKTLNIIVVYPVYVV